MDRRHFFALSTATAAGAAGLPSGDHTAHAAEQTGATSDTPTDAAPDDAADGGATTLPGELALWYPRPASEWLEALPIGNGRLGAMVFGGTDAERLQLNEDTVWAGGPYDPANPQGLSNLPEIRRRVFAGEWADAQALIDSTFMGNPLSELPYQTVGDL
ncbi:glycoside hydrolase N-terminal domain-containing protein, partial [Streptomyces sp. MCAF7]